MRAKGAFLWRPCKIVDVPTTVTKPKANVVARDGYDDECNT